MNRSSKTKTACVYCGSDKDLTVEHVVPISRWREFGVRRRVLDNDSNRVHACLKCNAEKGAMLPREWFHLCHELPRSDGWVMFLPSCVGAAKIVGEVVPLPFMRLQRRRYHAWL